MVHSPVNELHDMDVERAAYNERNIDVEIFARAVEELQGQG